MDFGSHKEASTAASFINGLGSIGAVLTGVLVGFISVMAGAGVTVILQLFMWNARGTN